MVVQSDVAADVKTFCRSKALVDLNALFLDGQSERLGQVQVALDPDRDPNQVNALTCSVGQRHPNPSAAVRVPFLDCGSRPQLNSSRAVDFRVDLAHLLAE